MLLQIFKLFFGQIRLAMAILQQFEEILMLNKVQEPFIRMELLLKVILYEDNMLKIHKYNERIHTKVDVLDQHALRNE